VNGRLWKGNEGARSYPISSAVRQEEKKANKDETPDKMQMDPGVRRGVGRLSFSKPL